MRVLITDDHQGVRIGIRDSIAEAIKRPVEFVEGASWNELFQGFRADFDLIIVDLMMPGLSQDIFAIDEALARLQGRGIPFGIYTQATKPVLLACAEKHGAAFYINKIDHDHFVQAAGSVLMGHALERNGFEGELGEHAKLLKELMSFSTRSQETFCALLSNEQDQEIADRFGLTKAGLSKRTKKIYEVLGVTSRREFLHLAHELGLVL